MKPYSHILLGTDLGEASRLVTERAKQMAAAHHAKLTAVHVIEPVPVNTYGNSAQLLDAFEKIKDQAHQEVSRFCSESQIPEQDVRVEIGPVKFILVDVAKELGADLIVVGTHSYHGLHRLLGSTASYVLTHASCDVLTVCIPNLGK